MEQAETVDRQNGMPAFSAAWTAWTSPRRAYSPASPTGASATGMASLWPKSVVVRSILEMSLMTR